MKRDRFTRAEAEAKVGKTIKTRVDFSGVSKGTIGQVVKADKMGKDEWDAVIRWDLPNERVPLDDWFTKDEYERFLEEL